MTKRNFLKSELLKELALKLKPHGFKLNKTLAEYTKNNKAGWYKYQIVFLLTDQGWELKPCVLLRFDIVENIFHNISGFEEKYKKSTPTLGISIEDFQADNKSFRYQLIEETQINNIMEELYSVFQKNALLFFEKYSSMEKIDNALNIIPKDTSLTGSIFKGFKALIIAKLVERKNYKELEELYFNYYKIFSDGFYLADYKKLIVLLEDVSKTKQLIS